MTQINTAPVPDFYGHTVFCDDIRLEIDGKITFVGSYPTHIMYAKAAFPLVLPKFCFAIFFSQRRSLFKPDLKIRIYLPGDLDDKASIEGDFNYQGEMPTPDDKFFVLMGSNVTFSPFTIEEPGHIKVRILREGVLHRIGTLEVRPIEVTSPVTAPNET